MSTQFENKHETETLTGCIQSLLKQVRKKQSIIDEISFINNHNIRRPVTNILRLLHLMDDCQEDLVFLKSIIGKIKTSANELDTLTREIDKLIC